MSLSDGKEERLFVRSDASKVLLGALTTFAVGLSTKLITLALASESATEIIQYLNENFSFWMQLLITSGTGGYFAQKWTRRNGK